MTLDFDKFYSDLISGKPLDALQQIDSSAFMPQANAPAYAPAGEPGQLIQSFLPSQGAGLRGLSVNRNSVPIQATQLDAIQPKDVPIDFNRLAAAYSVTESGRDGYEAVGRPTGVKMGIALGRYQYMSGRDDVRQAITANGGTEFLQRLDQISRVHADKSNLSKAEKEEVREGMDRFFPKKDQDRLFVRDQTHLYNVAVRQMGSTDQKVVLERMFEMHYGGTGSTIHGGARDVNGRYDLAGYGKVGLRNYENAAAPKIELAGATRSNWQVIPGGRGQPQQDQQRIAA